MAKLDGLGKFSISGLVSGKRWASGTGNSGTGNMTVSGLSFTPSVIIVEFEKTAGSVYILREYNDFSQLYPTGSANFNKADLEYNGTSVSYYDTNAWTVGAGTFTCQIENPIGSQPYYGNLPAKWLAIE